MDSLRYDSISRSPVNSLFVVALNSLPTLRVFKREKWLIDQYESLVDQIGRAQFSFAAYTRWLQTSVECLSFSFILILFVVTQFALPRTVGVPTIAFSITSPINLMINIPYLARFTVDLASCFASIERMQAYTKIKQETA